MNAREAKEKARTFLKQEGIDDLLLKLYLEVKYYPPWSANHRDREDTWNFGVTAISSSRERMPIGYEEKDVSMVVGEFDGRKFKIGGASYIGEYPDGECFCRETIRFGFREAGVTAVEAVFSFKDADACVPSDYSLVEVEELHYSDKWIEFLKNASRSIDAFEVRKKLQREREETAKYEGKFTFGDKA